MNLPETETTEIEQPSLFNDNLPVESQSDATALGGENPEPGEALVPPSSPAPVSPVDQSRIELERENAVLKSRLSMFETPAPTEAVEQTPKQNWGDRVFSDPDGAREELIQEAVTRIRTDGKVEADRRAFWDKFYSENEDLRGCEDIVDLTFNKNFENLKKVEINKASKIIANEARARVGKIRDSGTPTETLSSKRAVTAGASGPSTPKVSTPAKPVSFVEQMRAMQAKKKKTG